MVESLKYIVWTGFNSIFTKLQMETVIKQAEESRNRALDTAKRVHEDYRPLKHDIDRLRREYLGLDRLPELHEEEGDLISSEYVL